MTDLLAARSQMALSLGFHILFAVAGIAMPLLMVVAEWQALRSGDPIDLALAKRWAKGTAILFAVGAVSGTVLSFELGLLWPGFMGFAGSIIGMPFSLEGFAFFTEAIFLGIYLYGWRRVPPRMHLAAGVVVAVSGAASAVFVVIANAWMNTPVGFRMEAGKAVDVDPLAAMASPAALPQVLHMILAAYAAIGGMVAGIHALGLLRQPAAARPLHRRALRLALWVGGLAAVAQPLSGDLLARAVARNQPVKLAALEGQFHTETAAPLRIGGLPDVAGRTTRYALEIPYGLSLLAFHDPHARVQGLLDFPVADWPAVTVVHVCFQVMVACGLLMGAVALLALLFGVRARRGAGSTAPARAAPQWPRWFLWLVVCASPAGLLAIETGWVVTELGRQPWIIYGVLRTADAVTPMPELWAPLLTFTVLYLFLAVMVLILLRRQVADSATGEVNSLLAETSHG
jgi:cytochrome d ubiquinol oxidase subunit I